MQIQDKPVVYKIDGETVIHLPTGRVAFSGPKTACWAYVSEALGHSGYVSDRVAS